MNGSANIEGGPLFHLMTGHLSHQIEHHLFPDLPASRYPEMAPRVKEICERYGQRYSTGSFRRQLGSVVKRIVRLSLPGPKTAATRGRARGADVRPLGREEPRDRRAA
jgi:linoleoyl-CoA desaturase